MTLNHRALFIAPCLLLGACFEDPTPAAEEIGDGDGTGTEGGGDGDGDGDGDSNAPPRVDAFTINGSDIPAPIEAASGILLEAMASDPDGDLSRVEFESANQLLGSVSGAGPVAGDRSLRVRVRDRGGHHCEHGHRLVGAQAPPLIR